MNIHFKWDKESLQIATYLSGQVFFLNELLCQTLHQNPLIFQSFLEFKITDKVG